MPNKPPILISIYISHYCEKVRWALDLLEIKYIEENHIPPFHSKHTKKYGGKTTPILVTKDGAYVDSTDILQYLDRIVPRDRKIYPQEPELRREVEQLEELFDRQLGVASRSFGYYYAAQKPHKILLAWLRKIPLGEKIGIAIAFPLIFSLIKKKFNLTEASKDKALKIILATFERVNCQLEDGRQYLVGERLSAADLTFAALASPVLRPPNHPAYSADLSQLPSEMRLQVKQLRETPAGKFALRLYRQERLHSINK